ncbi:MAG: ABC transporter substrate-binding protein [Bacteroidia bacterium]|nr:ABC transporter substrate-binding protein [Bacteroidia bacterium]
MLPRSVIYPSINFDIVDGIRAGLLHERCEQTQIVTASIGIAAKNDEVYARCEQLLMDGADVVVAYVNPSTAEFIHPLFTASGKMLIVLDSGMHFPSAHKLSNAFFISAQGALCCRVSARLAVRSGTFVNAFTCSFYDAGYRTPLAFIDSLDRAGGSIAFNYITPLKRSEFSLEPLANHLQENPTHGVLAGFCGDMAEDFFKAGKKLDLFAKYTIWGSPYMTEELWLDKIPYPGGPMKTSVTWARSIDIPGNRAFMQALNKPGKANIFSVIAWEAAVLIAAASEDLTSEAATAKWAGNHFEGPRGKLFVNPDTNFVEAPVYIAEVNKQPENEYCRLDVLSEADCTEDERALLQANIKQFSGEVLNSWYNAYPCLDS